MRTTRTRAAIATAAVATLLLTLAPTLPAEAHGVGIVKSCEPGVDCIANPSSANNATFAVCDPLPALTTGQCSHAGGFSPASPRSVNIEVANFGKDVTVHVWFLNGEVDNSQASDCSQLVGGRGNRTHLGDVQTDPVTGKGNLPATLPPGLLSPPSLQTGWSYGDNWICGTTAPHGGGTGVIGDQLFLIYPA